MTVNAGANRPPLEPSPLVKLPAGAVRPRGWLLRQLELQAEGYPGRLEELSVYLDRANNAWLDPEGHGVDAGEEVPYWLRGFVALGAVLGDEQILATSCFWIDAVLSSRRADGYFGPEVLRTAAGGRPYLLNHFYMVHALQTWQELRGDDRVLEHLMRFYRWQHTIPERDLIAEGWQHPRGMANLVGIYWLYNRTSEPWLLELAGRNHRQTAPFGGQTHGVNICERFAEGSLWWMQSHDAADRGEAERNWSAVGAAYGQVPGGMFAADEQTRGGFFGPRQGAEACSMVETMRSCEHLLCALGEGSWADRCEVVAYNSYPAAATADWKALRYLTPPNLVASVRGNKVPDFYNLNTMLAFDPHCGPRALAEHAPEGYRCCLHNTGQGWASFAQHLWLATPDGGLAAAFYAPCAVTTRVGRGIDLTLTESTRYPFDGTVEITLVPAEPVRFPLLLRIPGWCTGATLRVNGEKTGGVPAAGSFHRVERVWSPGDHVRLELPMRTSVTRWPRNKDCASVHRGPLAFSLKIGEIAQRCGGSPDWPCWEIRPGTPWSYGLRLGEGDPGAVFETVDRGWPAEDQPFSPEGTPVLLRAPASRVPEWVVDSLGVVGPLPASPVTTREAGTSVDLIPMGAARLRIAAFPVIAESGTKTARDWRLGPFLKRQEPVLSPLESTFRCPLRGEPVSWEALNVYNPAVVEKGGRLFMLYRADDPPWHTAPDGGAWRTSRIGLAWSDDGVAFERHPEPVLYPDRDEYQGYEWPGGCEDIHLLDGGQGTYYLYYTTWNGRQDTMSAATSTDLFHWVKHGPVFARDSPESAVGSRSGVVVTELRDGKLHPARIDGKYRMYYTHPSTLAESDDLIHWKLSGKAVWPAGRHETGAIALAREDGILLMFNGQEWGDLAFPPGSWTLGQALIDRRDLVTVLHHDERPFLYPELDWELGGDRYRVCVVPPVTPGPGHRPPPTEPGMVLTVVSNTLIPFRDRWMLYYGAADRYVGLATSHDVGGG